MPTNPQITRPPQEDNVKKLSTLPAPINVGEVAKDIAVNAANSFIPNLSVVTGAPTIIDANSLGILVQGAGFGQIKTFIAQAAIKSNQTITNQTSQLQLKSDNPAEMYDGYQKYFKNDRAPIANPNALLGQYLFDKVSFINNELTSYAVNSAGQLKKESSEKLDDLILNACIVSIDANRYVHQSIPVNSDAGTIKEIMAFGEYNIKITGHLINDNQPKEYPLRAIRSLDKLTKMTTYVNISSNFLNIFGITKVVITDFSLQQVEGFSGIVTYTITAISETIPGSLDPNLLAFGGTTDLQNPTL